MEGRIIKKYLELRMSDFKIDEKFKLKRGKGLGYLLRA